LERIMAVDFEAVRQRALAAEKAREEEQRREAERTVALLPRAAAILRRDYGAVRVGYFGSLLWGRLWEESDVDLYVDRIPPGKSYFQAIGDVADLLGRNVFNAFEN
jgi:predicted nucleotidyltransferase